MMVIMSLVMGVVMVEVAIQRKCPAENEENPDEAGGALGAEGEARTERVAHAEHHRHRAKPEERHDRSSGHRICGGESECHERVEPPAR